MPKRNVKKRVDVGKTRDEVEDVKREETGASCFHSRLPNKEEANALKALYKGEATPRQQRLALFVIVNKFSKGQGLHYIPGSFDETAFVSGRAFVGQKILTMIKVPIGELELEQEEETPNDKT